MLVRRGSEKVAPFAPSTQPLTVANAPPNLWAPHPTSSAKPPAPSGYPVTQAQAQQWPGFQQTQGYPSALMGPTPQAPAGRLQPLPQAVVSGLNLPPTAAAGAVAPGYGGGGYGQGGYSGGMQGGYPQNYYG